MTIEQNRLRVKKLIQAKRYEEARDILLTVNDPTADKLLARLNKRLDNPPKIKREATDALNSADMKKARRLIKAQRYAEAEAILITIEDPIAERWLERLPVAGTHPSQHAGTKDFTNSLVISIILLFTFALPGIIALWIFAKDAKQYPHAPGASAIITLHKVVSWIIVISIILICGITFLISVGSTA